MSDIDLNSYKLFRVEGQSQDTTVKVHFDNLFDIVKMHIENARVVLGCVAWVIDRDILNALSEKHSVWIAIQKEDFLRPDLLPDNDEYIDWKRDVYSYYEQVRCNLDPRAFTNAIAGLDEIPSEGFRSVGHCKGSTDPTIPRMHHKFLLFCDIRTLSEREEEEFGFEYRIEPYAVWTGSFNLATLSRYSLENGLYITDPNIVDAYYQEFGQIMILSEPLDWESEWMQPQWVKLNDQ